MRHDQALRILRQTKTNYNTIASEWDVSRGRPSALKLRLIKPVKKGWRTLDLGCGNGFLAPELVKRGAYYTGLDISARLLNFAKKKYREAIKSGTVEFVLGDALKMPFRKNNFDFVFSYAVMHHIPSDELRIKFLKEIRRVLKPGAEAIIDNWNLLNDWEKNKYNIEEQLKNVAPGHDAGDVYVPWKATKNKVIKRYLHLFKNEELRQLAKAAGFKQVRIEYRDRLGRLKKSGEGQILKLKK